MDFKVAVDTTCHLLRLPAEIRLNIYRYLLLEPLRASLDPNYHEKFSKASMDQHQEQSAFVDDVNEVQKDFYEHYHNNPPSEGEGAVMLNYLAVNQSSPPSETPSETFAIDQEMNAFVDKNEVYEHNCSNPDAKREGSVMFNHLAVNQSNPTWDTLPPASVIDEEEFVKGRVMEDEKHVAERRCKLDDEYKVQRYPAILQTNRQIYEEASTLLYSSLVIEVRPGDVMFSDSWDGIVDLSDNIWRSRPLQPGVKNNPIEGLGYRGFNLGGTMEPHVFAKFERVSLNADLNFVEEHEEEVALWPIIFVDDKFHTDRVDEAKFVACLNGEGTNRPPVSNIIQQFVNVLVKSPYISHLDVSLGVEVEAAFDIDSESEDEEEENNERSKQQDEKEERKMKVANERATELVLEAGVLGPLKQLSNVKCFGFSFALLQRNGSSFKPRPKHLEIVRDLKDTVEGNFVAKHGAI